MNVAVIPARGGSKRIPGKNIKNFAGKPIISYSIEAAKNSGLFDRIVVSTDSEEIANVAIKAGAEVPFARPEELSDDHVMTQFVLTHAIDWLNEHGPRIQYFCCIYPTAPLIDFKRLKSGYELLREKKSSEVYSVTTFDFSIFRAMEITKEGLLKFLWPENELKRSQDFPEAYHDAGQFYWFDSEEFLKHNMLYSPKALPFIIPRCLVQDIDTQEDWEMAELMYEACRKKGVL